MRENELSQYYSTDIAKFWQRGTFSNFTGVGNMRVNYAAFTDPKNQHSLVIAPGRCEGYLKYKELILEFFNKGYDVFIIDHRGQGISERMLTNPHKGYVANFDDYRDDLYYFINTIVADICFANNKSTKPFLLAHSMGGAISIRLLQQHPHCIQAAVLGSPMIAINTGAIPSWFARAIIKSAEFINRALSNEPWYFLGQKNFAMENFAKNSLTQSTVRYQLFSQLYHDTDQIQLGGATIHWLNEAIKANLNIFTNIEKLSTPILVLQAGADTIVDNSAQALFCRQVNTLYPYSCNQGEPVTIKDARHELFFEQDQYRDIAIEKSLNWFSQHSEK